ncbi:MAG TPA: hypothetical protein VLQ65_13510 [Saliniramus sp.]|nr:hypothetical protein [Saliniramus sp.]
MNRSLITAAAALVAVIGLASAAQAGVGNSRGSCYNHVISACNKNDNTSAAHACANSGMNACDKQFPQKANATPFTPGEIQAMRARVLGDVAAPARTGSTPVRVRIPAAVEAPARLR